MTVSPATLSARFRAQRSDRIRVDETEVLSLVELILEPGLSLEVIIESAREDVEQGLALRTKNAVLSVRQTPSEEIAGEEVEDEDGDGDGDETSADEIEPEIADTDVQCIQLPGRPMRTEIEGPQDAEIIVKIWNLWRLGDTDHAWTGNCGIVVEDLDAPEGAHSRQRLWCSDGLGDPSFDDLVVLLTVGERI